MVANKIKTTKAQKEFWRKYLNQNIRTGKNLKKIQPGHMYIYNYESKLYGEGRLPYYDAYPLILVISMKNDGWLGLSLHYLPPKIREFFIKKVIIKNHKLLSKGKSAEIPYEVIKASGNLWFKEGLVIIKRYLKSYVRSKIAEIPWTEWSNIVSGEGAKWIDVTAVEVYRETRKALRKEYNKNKKKPKTSFNKKKKTVKKAKSFTPKKKLRRKR